ncbi:uncharacterized protein KD926_010484 [Aspergillus affinis]|uniref:uncharacterized protein n=1 Tax=Aspergillus affinis TaxID=1070780 RepID=UPI0022FE95C0|nr:uncharacterized protein KD926_010484 [Aspergillus affinis]KAI9038749.1 hypothetical protein KD926_010484 [Aspergillus affinis]
MRALTACQLCRSKKVKCNNARPSCSHCEKSKATCVYGDSQDISSFDSASLLILDKLNHVLSRLDDIQVPVTRLAPLMSQVGGPDITATEADRTPTQIDMRDHETEGQDQDSDELHIPSSRANVDAVLQWPIFGTLFPPNYITDAVFGLECCDEAQELEGTSRGSNQRLVMKTSSLGIDEEEIIDLVQAFLELVHIKNPILDIGMLCSYARSVVEDGLKWDPASCLVLLSCALGRVATRFVPAQVNETETQSTSLDAQAQDLRQGEAYYNLARRRFGILGTGILSSQCYFLAGVYNMYIMRPLTAWSQFQSATKSYWLYLQCQAKKLPHQIVGSTEASKRRSMEQRLYWSCYKAECELRAEINLPNSSLADIHYSDMHPSPPDIDDDGVIAEFGLSPQERPSWSRSAIRTTFGSRQQHEQTWYYYLTEITLRRIANRVLNLFYAGDYSNWTSDLVPFMVKAAEQFEQQLQEWYAGLPPLIQFRDDAPPIEELPYHVRDRVLEIKTWIYAPFLHYAIHSPPGAPYRDIIQPLVEKSVAYSFYMMRDKPNWHRHHGSWYMIRSIASSCLLILGAIRCCTIPVPGEWREEIRAAIRRMQYWAAEGPGIYRAIEVLETYLKDA